MENYIVLYRDDFTQFVEAFACQADDYDHAEEQATNAYPNVQIILAHQGNSVVYQGVTYSLNRI